MRITMILTLAAAATSLAQQPNQTSTADPALQKLNIYVGQWKYEGIYRPGPTGPGGNATGEVRSRMFFRGHFLEWRWKEKGPTGETEGLEILQYDPVKKNFPSRAYEDTGGITSGAYVLGANKTTFSGQYSVGGKQYRVRTTETFAPDMASFAQIVEISTDGKSWLPFFDGRFVKTAPAPK
jgi:hypothetical protein